jgi:hypothetical protein
MPMINSPRAVGKRRRLSVSIHFLLDLLARFVVRTFIRRDIPLERVVNCIHAKHTAHRSRDSTDEDKVHPALDYPDLDCFTGSAT